MHNIPVIKVSGKNIPEAWEKAELGRLECRREFAFDAAWNGRRYATKQIRPIFVEEPEEIVVITVYTYYY